MSGPSQATPDLSSERPASPSPAWLVWLCEGPRWQVLLLALAISLVILYLDIVVHSEISTGILYIVPCLIAGLRIGPWQVLLMSVVFTVAREHFGNLPWSEEWPGRFFYGYLSFAGSGLFAGEVARSRRLILGFSQRLQEQVQLREEAEGQLKTLVESSPAAIVTLDGEGVVILANLAAHDLLAIPAGSLLGQPIKQYLPVMADLLQTSDRERPYRTATNCRGQRANGESFLACVWFATYVTAAGPRLAAIITDASEDLRDWQETSLQSLLRSTRVLVGSVSHEIRNICAAITVVHANLGRLEGVAASEDYAALGTLAQGLARLATVELAPGAEQDVDEVNLEQLLEEFRIVVSPTTEAAETELSVHAEPDLPHVLGDRHGLLQVLLNLVRNSVRALGDASIRRIEIDARRDGATVLVRVRDSGPGVAHPERLFQPFQHGADAVGLGLFLSRAIVRAAEGELYLEPTTSGCTMCLRLKICEAPDAAFDPSKLEIAE